MMLAPFSKTTTLQVNLGRVLELAGIKPLLEVPTGVEVVERWQTEQRLLFVLNHSRSTQTVKLDKFYCDLLSDERKTGLVELKPNEVLILTDGAER